jgi:hypothetical protein
MAGEAEAAEGNQGECDGGAMLRGAKSVEEPRSEVVEDLFGGGHWCRSR